MSRPHLGLSADALFERGLRAQRDGNRPLFAEYLKELQSRCSRLARDLAEELAEEGRGQRDKFERSRGWAVPVDLHDLRDAHVLADAAIIEYRTQMLAGATSSVWLSSYTYVDLDDALTEQLAGLARREVAVRLIISKGRAKHEDVQRQIRVLERGGVEVHTQEPSHSKCVVVDGEHVLLGSANLNETFRDLSFAVRSACLGAEVIRYLCDVAGEAA